MSSQECFTTDDGYELRLKREDFYKNKMYLKDKTCCNSKSCHTLAFEFEKLANKCHDLYREVGALDANEKGHVDSPICTNLQKIRDDLYNKATLLRLSEKYQPKAGGKFKKTKKYSKSKKNKKTKKYSRINY